MFGFPCSIFSRFPRYSRSPDSYISRFLSFFLDFADFPFFQIFSVIQVVQIFRYDNRSSTSWTEHRDSMSPQTSHPCGIWNRSWMEFLWAPNDIIFDSGHNVGHTQLQWCRSSFAWPQESGEVHWQRDIVEQHVQVPRRRRATKFDNFEMWQAVLHGCPRSS